MQTAYQWDTCPGCGKMIGSDRGGANYFNHTMKCKKAQKYQEKQSKEFRKCLHKHFNKIK